MHDVRLLLIVLTAIVATSARAEKSLHFQVTTVTQDHPPFKSDYEGTNSLQSIAASETSMTLTVFGATSLWHNAEFYIDPEMAGGQGFSHTKGAAAFPNGEIYRVDEASPKWNLARAYLKQVFEFGGEQEEIKDDQHQLARKIDQKRFTVIAGRFSLNDFFDTNTYSHDPRTQFLNWALMDNGAWDYAADTRGYTWGVYLEYNQAKWAVRFASVLEPSDANGPSFDTEAPVHRGDNAEFEYRYDTGKIRALIYENVADMGNYRDAINANADIATTRATRTKYGAGLNWEQKIDDNFGLFARLGWNDGKTETWAFTEIDRSFSIGTSVSGKLWHREEDHAGFALIASLLSNDHRDYLAGGQYGFLIGDGKLSYGAEEVLETYYLFHVQGGLSATGDYQFFVNPAYNQDRGPISVFSLRLHYEI